MLRYFCGSHMLHTQLKQCCYCFGGFPWSPLDCVLLFMDYCPSSGEVISFCLNNRRM